MTPSTVAMGFSRQEYWSGSHSLLQGIFSTQGLNLGLLHCRQILYQLSQRYHFFFPLILTNKEKISVKLRNLPKETQLWMMWVSTNFYLFHTAPRVEKTRFLLPGRFQSITSKCESLYILHTDHIRFCAVYILSKVCGEKWRNGCWFLLKSVWWR